jgi:predicted Mrr-cat superfamily restriction endonuclease
MPRHWIIAPVESDPADVFNRVWDFDRANGMITIGWGELGDVSKMSRQELLEAVTNSDPKKPPQTRALIANMLWAFHHEIGVGDFIIARRGRKVLAGVGEVSKPASYSPGINPYIDHPNV